MNALHIDWPVFRLCILFAALVIAARVLWTRVKHDEVDHG